MNNTDQVTVAELFQMIGAEKAENFRKDKTILRLTRELVELKKMMVSPETTKKEKTSGR